MTRIAFIGLGVMGGPIARHLKQAGHDLTVYNRSRAKAENGSKLMAARWPLLQQMPPKMPRL